MPVVELGTEAGAFATFASNAGQFIYSNILWIVLICLFGSAISFLISILVGNKHRIRLFYLPSIKEGEMKWYKAKDITKVSFKNKTYDLSQVKPIMIKTVLGRMPLYFISQQSVHGMELNLENKTFENKYKPENIQDIVETKIVGDFLKESVSKKGLNLINFIAGIGIGAALVLVLKSAGVF